MGIRENIVNKAKEYLGYQEGANNDTIFGTWAGSPNQPWCAAFVCYVLRNAGIDNKIVPLFVSCTKGFNSFAQIGKATRDHITPNPGDIIFFIWKQGESTPDHVGLVERVENGKVYTIEGNRSDKVQEFSYDLNSWQIYGYVTPSYGEEATTAPVIEQPKADTVIKTVTVKVNSLLRIREGASTATNKIGEYHNGDKVDIYEIEGNWGRTNKGWICLDYTQEYTNAAPAPVANTSRYVLGLYQVNTPSGLNVRKSPNGTKLKAYINGTRFDTYELDGNWARTPSGWVCLDYCKLIRAY